MPLVLITIGIIRKKKHNGDIYLPSGIFLLVVYVFSFLFRDGLVIELASIPAIALICLALYRFFLKPKFDEARSNLEFDNRVLGTLDGLHLASYESGVKFGCTDSELRKYVHCQLEKSHKLPDNQFLIEYTTKRGWFYSSHTGRGDHILFALLCIAQYAQEKNNQQLIDWCESMMQDAERNAKYYWI